jgi:hypothetical protein
MVNEWIAASNQLPISKEVSIVPSLLSLIILFAVAQLYPVNNHHTRIFPSR